MTSQELIQEKESQLKLAQQQAYEAQQKNKILEERLRSLGIDLNDF